MKRHHNGLFGRAMAALSIALLSTLALAAPAQAVENQESGDQACWLNLDTDEVQCFADRETLLASVEAEGSAVSFEAGTDAAVAARGAASFGILTTYFLATLYADAGYAGASLDITTTNSWMCSGTDYNGNLSASWNDRVSSFESYGGCRTRLAQNINQGGSFYGPYTSSSALGAFNDVASSYRIMD